MYSVVRLSDGRTETASCVWLCEMLSVGYTIFMEVIWLCELLRRETGYCLHNCSVLQGWSNHRRQVAVATEVCTVAPNIRGSLVWNLLHITLLAPWKFDVAVAFFGKFVQPPPCITVATANTDIDMFRLQNNQAVIRSKFT